jgi:uncharacterized protein (TIGR02453 family)
VSGRRDGSGDSGAPPGRFDPDLFHFLAELKRNNDRDWFRANRARYLAHIEAPSLEFVRAVGPRLLRISPHLLCDPRPVGGSVMRIYRNLRISRDKTPFRTSVGIRFMHDAAGNADQYLPGFFLRLAPRDSWVYAGVWEPDRARLDAIRRAIVRRPAAWRKVRAAVPRIEGDSVKRPPAGFDPTHPFIDDICRAGFAVRMRVTEREATRADFPERFVRICERLDPLNRFLARALGVEY